MRTPQQKPYLARNNSDFSLHFYINVHLRNIWWPLLFSKITKTPCRSILCWILIRLYNFYNGLFSVFVKKSGWQGVFLPTRGFSGTYSDRIWHPPCTHFTKKIWHWVPTSPKKIWLGTHFTLTLMKANFNANWPESSLLPFYNVITDVWHFTIRLNNFMTEILQSIGFLKKMFHQKQNILIIFV